MLGSSWASWKGKSQLCALELWSSPASGSPWKKGLVSYSGSSRVEGVRHPYSCDCSLHKELGPQTRMLCCWDWRHGPWNRSASPTTDLLADLEAPTQHRRCWFLSLFAFSCSAEVAGSGCGWGCSDFPGRRCLISFRADGVAFELPECLVIAY